MLVGLSPCLLSPLELATVGESTGLAAANPGQIRKLWVLWLCALESLTLSLYLHMSSDAILQW